MNHQWDFASFQIALYFKTPIAKKFDELSVGLKKLGIFNEPEVSIFPVPRIQIEKFNIPVLDIKSTDNTCNASVGFMRSDLFYNTIQEGVELDSISTDIREKVDKFTNFFVNSESLEINRIGIVFNFITTKCKVTNLSELLKKQFTVTPKELNLRWNIKDTINGYGSNNISKIDSAENINTGESGIRLQRDINTSVEISEHVMLKHADILKYFDETLKLVSKEELDKVVSV